MVGNEADIRADLELDGTRAVNQIRRVAQEIRRTLTNARELERVLGQAFGQRTSITGARARGLTTATSALARGSDTAATINATVAGRAAAIRASTPMVAEALRKQNEQLERAVRAPQQRLRQAQAENQRIFDGLLGVQQGDRLQGRSRTQYERDLRRLFDERDRLLAQNVRRSQDAFNQLLAPALGRSGLQGAQRTQYERAFERLLNERDRRITRSTQTLEAQASRSQAAFNQLVAPGLARTAAQGGAPRGARDSAFARGPTTQAELRDRGETQRRIRNETLFGDGGRDLFRIQARLLAHYVILNQIFNAYRFGVTFVVDFDRALQNLQAITVTSNTNMQGLAVSLRQVSRETKFTAVEVAEAATILGQAGFSPTEIQQSIRSITLLAAATGSTLKQAVDVATATLGVFNLQAGEMVNVSNQITTSINRSKLNIEKLALGLQFAGNVAADAGLGLDELLASLAQFANAGVRSGSTLGTGIRQLIIDLAAPSRKLTARYRELGLSTDETSIKTQGFIGVLRNLRDAGFTGSDALEFLEVRAANAFSAITKGLPEIEGFRRELILANSAARANATQMESLANRWARFVSVMGEVVLTATGPIANMFKILLEGATDVGIAVADSGKTFTVFASILTGVGIAALTVWLARVTGIVRTTQAATASIIGLTTATRVMNAVLATSRALFAGLGGLLGAGIFLGIGALTNGFGLLSDSTADAAAEQDRAQAAFEDTQGRVQTLQQSISSIDDTIARLSDREQRLNRNQEELQTELLRTQQRFASLGLVIDGDVRSTQDLINALFNLREELQRGTPGALASQESAILLSQGARRAAVAERVATEERGGLEDFISTTGIPLPGPTGLGRRGRDTPTRRRRRRADQIVDFLRGRADGLEAHPLQGISGLPELVDTALEARFFPGPEGSIDQNRIDQAQLSATRLLNVPGLPEPIRRIIQESKKFLDDATTVNREVELERQRLQNTRSQRDAADFGARFPSGPILLNALQRRSRQGIVRVQTQADDPVAQQASLDAENRRIQFEVNEVESFILASFRDQPGRGQTGDRARFIQEYQQRLRNIVSEQARVGQKFLEDSVKSARSEIRGRRQVSNRRITNFRTALNAAQTPEQIQTLLDVALSGVGDSLLESSRLSELLPPDDGLERDFGELERFRGVFAQRFGIDQDELDRVETVGQPAQIARDIREARAGRQQGELFGVFQAAQRRLRRFETTRGQINRVLGRTEGRRGRDIGRRAGDLRAAAQFDLAGIRGRRQAFNIRQRGPGRLRGEAARQAGLELDREIISDSIGVYRRWAEAQREVISALEARREAQATNLANAQADLVVAQSQTEDLDRQKELAQDVDRATSSLSTTTNQLSTARRQLLGINRQLATEETKLAALPQDLDLIDQIIQSLENSTSEFGGTFELINRYVRGFRDAFQEAMSGVISSFLQGTITLEEVFRRFIDRILNLAINELANNLTEILFNSIRDGLTGQTGAGGGFGLGAIGDVLNTFFGSILGTTGGTRGVANLGPQGQTIPRRQFGGRIMDGVTGRDSSLNLLEKDEYVIRSAAARSVGYDTLDRINRQGVRALAPLGGAQTIGDTFIQRGPQELNVWVVSPENAPPPGPDDIVAEVVKSGERGGPVKQLVKRIQLGEV